MSRYSGRRRRSQIAWETLQDDDDVNVVMKLSPGTLLRPKRALGVHSCDLALDVLVANDKKSNAVTYYTFVGVSAIPTRTPHIQQVSNFWTSRRANRIYRQYAIVFDGTMQYAVEIDKFEKYFDVVDDDDE